MVAMEHDQVTLFHQDILEPILSHVPLIDLAPVSYVSKSWYRSVRNSLRYLTKPKPWLLVHTQNMWSPKSYATHAYDPRSSQWIEIKSPKSIHHASALKTSDSNLLYIMTPMKFSFSMDPLRMNWHHVVPLTIWRDNPVVSLVGRKIIVAGGVCDFEDDDLAVEAYDLDSGTWAMCESMPEPLRGSSMHLSVASDREKLYITRKTSGDIYVFHQENNTWSGPHQPRLDQAVFFSVTACIDGQLVLIGLQGGPDNQKIKLWKVDTSNFRCELIGEMPRDLVLKLGTASSIDVCYSRNLMYVYSPCEKEEMVTCELLEGGGLQWGSVRNLVQGRCHMSERVVWTCAEVELKHVDDAMRGENHRFTVKSV